MKSQKSLAVSIDRSHQVRERLPGNASAPKQIFRPEIELILCCARTRLDSDCAKRIAELSQGEIDWNYTVQTSIAHGIMPLLYRNLKPYCPRYVPENTLSLLRDYFRLHAQRNLLITRELLRLIRLLEAESIDTLPYKGPVLAASIYGDISLRTFSDVDLLVRKRDILRAKELLFAQGYQPRQEMTESREAAHLHSPDQKDFALISKDGYVKVELHWQITSLVLFPLDADSLWDRLNKISIGGRQVRNLAAEDLLLVLCIHGAKHFFARLEWISDISELIFKERDLDWQRVEQQARRLGNRRALFTGLWLAHTLLGAEIPARMLTEIEEDDYARSLASQMSQSLFREPDRWNEIFNRGGHRVFLRDRLMDRMRMRLYYYLQYLRIVLTPNEHDREAIPLPGSLSFLYYLIRPFRLIKSYGPTLLGHTLNRLTGRKPLKPNR